MREPDSVTRRTPAANNVVKETPTLASSHSPAWRYRNRVNQTVTIAAAVAPISTPMPPG